MSEFEKIKQEIFLNFCHQKDELLKNNCLIAELFDSELKEATDENPIIIKGGIGELKITKNKNSFTPNPKIWTATASEKQLIIYFRGIQEKNRLVIERTGKPSPSPEIVYPALAQNLAENLKNQPKPPTIKQMSKNFAKATAKWIKSGFETVTKSEFDERLEICRSCTFWDEKARLGMGKCNHEGCGCSKGKLWLKTEKCPIQKWK